LFLNYLQRFANMALSRQLAERFLMSRMFPILLIFPDDS